MPLSQPKKEGKKQITSKVIIRCMYVYVLKFGLNLLRKGLPLLFYHIYLIADLLALFRCNQIYAYSSPAGKGLTSWLYSDIYAPRQKLSTTNFVANFWSKVM